MVGDWTYWSSTEYSASNAWYLSSSGELDGNYRYGIYKNASRSVRGVRAF